MTRPRRISERIPQGSQNTNAHASPRKSPNANPNSSAAPAPRVNPYSPAAAARPTSNLQPSASAQTRRIAHRHSSSMEKETMERMVRRCRWTLRNPC